MKNVKREPGFELYYAALAADEAFRKALIKVYGEKRAADARYQSNHDSVVVMAARDEKLSADAAWLAQMESGREGSRA